MLAPAGWEDSLVGVGLAATRATNVVKTAVNLMVSIKERMGVNEWRD